MKKLRKRKIILFFVFDMSVVVSLQFSYARPSTVGCNSLEKSTRERTNSAKI